MALAWESIAISLGYKDPAEMWETLYLKQGLSVSKLSKRFAVATGTVTSELRRWSIPIRKRGGRNFVKIEVTPELEAEIEKHGVRFVAKERKVDVTTLYKAVYYKHGKRLRQVPKPPEQSAERDTPGSSDSEGQKDHGENR